MPYSKCFCPSAFNVDIIVGEIQDTIRQEEVQSKEGWSAIFYPTPTIRRMLLIGLGFPVAQQLTGIESIQYFLLFVFAEAGIKDQSAQYGFLIFLAFLKMIFVVVAGRYFDTYGRRPLVKNSLIGKILVRGYNLNFDVYVCYFLKSHSVRILIFVLFLLLCFTSTVFSHHHCTFSHRVFILPEDTLVSHCWACYLCRRI